jgi:conjugal transfer pilin signal peptidase TrbI
MNRSLRTQAIDFAAHMRRRWYFYLPVFAIWAFAYTRLFIDPTPRVPVLFNWTGSLPYRVAWLQQGDHPLQRGEFVIFSFAGEARTAYPGLDGQPFFKVVRGLPGDVVTVSGRTVSVNGVVVGTAKAQAFDRATTTCRAPARTRSTRATAAAGSCGPSRSWAPWCRCSEGLPWIRTRCCVGRGSVRWPNRPPGPLWRPLSP